MKEKYCSNKNCNPLFPFVANVKMKKELVDDTSSYKCPSCKHEFDAGDLQKEGIIDCPSCKYYKGKLIRLRFSKTWREYCPSCRERNKKFRG